MQAIDNDFCITSLLFMINTVLHIYLLRSTKENIYYSLGLLCMCCCQAEKIEIDVCPHFLLAILNNFLLTESAVIAGEYQTEVLTVRSAIGTKFTWHAAGLSVHLSPGYGSVHPHMPYTP